LAERKVEVMAGRKEESTGVGGSTRPAGKVGRLKVEGRQGRLTPEDKEGGKRVTFKIGDKEEKETGAEGVTEMKTGIRQIVRKEIKDSLKEQEDRIRKELEEIKVNLKRGEEKVEGLRNIERRWEEKWEEIREEVTRIEKEVYETDS